MTSELIGAFAAVVVGLSGVGALAKALFDRRKTDADALATWNTVWTGNLDRLTAEIAELRERVAALESRNQILTALLIEHRIDLPD